MRSSALFEKIITKDKKLLSIFHYIESIAQTSQPVLITGETGVGKELIAKSIHPLSGRKGRFLTVNVAGLDDSVFSDTLFGHAKGAFTGADQVRHGLIEQTKGGTLFLDEIGDLSTMSQVKLLRLIQEGEYMPLGVDEIKKTDVRIVLSTNKDLWSLQRAGKFRKDLNFRIRTHHINIPPLRERMDDIPLLVNYFLDKTAYTLGKKTPKPPAELFKLLQGYSFPGNVRELQTMIFDAVSINDTKTLSLKFFKARIKEASINNKVEWNNDKNETSSILFPEKLPTIKQVTELLVEEAMRRANYNQSAAAKILGVSQQALSKRIKKQKDLYPFFIF
jgi:transcriptional regulator with PAS, ATPase and Fis domain